MISKTLLAGCFIWAVFLFTLLILRPKSKLHSPLLNPAGSTPRWIIPVVLLLTILLCIIPMGLSPYYNGERPDFTNQYELMAESILNGHLYIDYPDIDPKLLALDNPYDFEARKAAEVSYHWDHAFYNGRYYMYFGIVPSLSLSYRYKPNHLSCDTNICLFVYMWYIYNILYTC